MNELCVAFGSDRHLVGTLALPDAARARPLAVILLNAGVIHRIGPHRFNVKLARGLADAGLTSLRFDLSGQGDSGVAPEGASMERQAVIDIRAALDHVERVTGIRQFVIAGICSGADHGLALAQEDVRVVGLWMMDGHVYPTPKTRRLRYQRRLESGAFATLASALWRRCGGAIERLHRLGTATDAAAPERSRYARPLPSAAVYAAALQALVDRGVQVFLFYSGSLLERFNYHDQFRDAFTGYRFVDVVRCDFAPHVDHSVTPLHVQRELIATVCEWAVALCPPDIAALKRA